jgi:hypothetical protein
MPPKRKRGVFERENDLTRTSELYLKQWRQIDIAKEMGVTQQQISWDIKEIRARWLAAQINNMNEIKSRELDRIDSLEREYWMAWEKSKGRKFDHLPSMNPKPKRRKKGNGGVLDQVAGVMDEMENMNPKPEPVSDSVLITENPHGDPRYLTGVQWCINRRLVLLGLDAPTKSNSGVDPTSVSDEQRITRVNELLRKAAQRKEGKHHATK